MTCKITDNSGVDLYAGVSNRIKFIPRGGMAVKLVNKTGAPSVLGNVVSPSLSVDNAFTLCSNNSKVCGIVDENGIPDGQDCWIVLAGIGRVMVWGLSDSGSTARGWRIAATNLGINGIASTRTGIPATWGNTALFFRMVGRMIEAVPYADHSSKVRTVLFFD